MIRVFFDGICEPVNPNGIAAYGFVIYQDNMKLVEGREFVAEGAGASNNVAEYSALGAVLMWLLEHSHKDSDILVKGDSMLVVNQMSGLWRVKGGMYLPAYRRANELAQSFSHLAFEWVPREQNSEADALSRRAYEERCIQTGRAVRYRA